MANKAYRAVEQEIAKLREDLRNRSPDAERQCSALRMNIGALKPSARQKAILFVRKMEELDRNLLVARQTLEMLQREIDLDLRREGIVRQEELLRHEKERQRRLEALQRIIEEKRERRRRLQAPNEGEQ